MNRGGEDAQQTAILAAVLGLWDEVLQGRVAEPTRLADWPLVAETVGGYLTDPAGDLVRAARLRDLLRTWLRPRPGCGVAGEAAEPEFETFLVSWALADRPAAARRWERRGLALRMDPAEHIGRATGWEIDNPSTAGRVRYPYLDRQGVFPGGQAGELVDDAVAELLNSGAAWLGPKQSRLPADMRQLLTPELSAQLRLFDGHPDDADATPTTELTRLAFMIAVGTGLSRYVSRLSDPTSDADEAVRALAAEVLPYWSEPQERRELLRLSVDFGLLGDLADGTGGGELGVPFADFRAVFRTFADKARFFHETAPTAEAPQAQGGVVALRRLSILLELAITDVLRYRRDAAVPIDDVISDLILEVIESRNSQRDSVEMLDIQRRLRAPRSERPDWSATRGDSYAFLTGLLDRLANDRQFGIPIPPGRAADPADGRDVQRLVDLANQYLSGGKGRPETILHVFAETLPQVVTALAPGNDAALPVEFPAEARWQLLRASGDALAREPATTESLIVAGSFAELGWVVANERLPADMRKINDQVYGKLLEVNAGPVAADVAGPLTRLMRVRPLADSKKANFELAQRAAHQSVIYGSQALRAAMRDAVPQVHRIVAALTGLQLSVLQAGGVFVRSAETELILRMKYSSQEGSREHAWYIRDLATSAFTYTNLAIARLEDLDRVVKAGIVAERDINYPTTAAASTAAMGMRTLLLWATMHLAYPNDDYPRQQPADISRLIPSIPGYFEKMLTLRHLNPLNFADMTRIAMHYAFLCGSFRHPAHDATDVHPATPEHLRPGQTRLDLNECGAYLRANRFDTGILDVIELDPVCRLLDEKSQGRYGEWRSGYHNPVRRSPTRFTRGELAAASIVLRDPTIAWQDPNRQQR
jgi:hypothetical protein